MKNLWKTVLALGFAAGMGLASLSAQTTEEPVRTITPEEVPVMNPAHLVGTQYMLINPFQGIAKHAYDTDGDGNIDSAYFFSYDINFSEMREENFKLLRYSIDHNRNGIAEESEIVDVDYQDPSEVLEQPEQVRTVRPEDVPIMNPLQLTKLRFRPTTDESQGYLDIGYNTDEDTVEDARFVYAYIKKGNVIDTGLIAYAFDVNNNAIFDEEEWVEVEYENDSSERISVPEYIQPSELQSPQLPETQDAPQLRDYHKLWNDFFDLEEEDSKVGA